MVNFDAKLKFGALLYLTLKPHWYCYLLTPTNSLNSGNSQPNEDTNCMLVNIRKLRHKCILHPHSLWSPKLPGTSELDASQTVGVFVNPTPKSQLWFFNFQGTSVKCLPMKQVWWRWKPSEVMIESDLISNCWCIVSAEILSKQRAKPFSAKIFPRIIFAFLRQALFLIQLFLQDWHWQVAAITRLSSIFKQTTTQMWPNFFYNCSCYLPCTIESWLWCTSALGNLNESYDRIFISKHF